MAKYFTKSDFRVALECETQLYYATRKDKYANQRLNNTFLEALADGGFQVGALAQFLLMDDPVAADIQCRDRSQEGGLKETATRMSQGNAIICEASFAYKDFFARTDIVRKNGSELELYEVKAKSYNGDRSVFWQKKKHEISSKWKPDLYDVAFQTWVVRNGHPELSVHPFLVLADKTKTADIDGLNQCFKILGKNSVERIEIKPGLVRSDLGTLLVTQIDVSEEVEYLLTHPIDSKEFGSFSFDEYLSFVASHCLSGDKIRTATGPKCKSCPFRNDESVNSNSHLRSGFHECWQEQNGLSPDDFGRQLVLDLWNYREIDDAISQGKYFLSDLVRDSKWSSPVEPSSSGLTPEQRQTLQIQKEARRDSTPFVFTKGLKSEMEKWRFPLHFIDFETAVPALPFTRGHHAYETVAFQFSLHNIDENGNIRHAGQFVSDTPGKDPNYSFLAELKKCLDQDGGTVFRYAAHENTVLSAIRRTLLDDPNPPKEKDDLVAFVESLIHYEDEDGNPIKGSRCMVDMFDLVKRYYYHPMMKGSNSIKQVLPAVIASSKILKEKYSQPIYGTEEIPSLNFKNHTWIDARMDPYKTLPPLLDDLKPEELSQLAPELEGFDEIHEGGAAATAYCKLQFADIPTGQRKALIDGLKRYCELDTMAMVMIYEYWREVTGY